MIIIVILVALNVCCGLSIELKMFNLLTVCFFFGEQAGEFCVYYGLSVTGDCVNFQRSSFVEPETRFPMKRALNLIESKRNCSIGEVSPALCCQRIWDSWNLGSKLLEAFALCW